MAGIMGLREGILVLVLVAVSWTYADARNSLTIDIMDTPVDKQMANRESQVPEALERNEQLCTLCEDFTAQATYSLAENKTQDDIMDVLHQACSGLRSLEQQCLILVDFYGSLFFKMISTIRPEEFCTKVNLCEQGVSVSLPKKNDTCTLCHQVVVQVLLKLRDPDTQLEIIAVLLKECNKLDRYAQQCKVLVLRYGPLILANGEQFLETTDVCASIHACNPSKVEAAKPEALAVDSLLEKL